MAWCNFQTSHLKSRPRTNISKMTIYSINSRSLMCWNIIEKSFQSQTLLDML
jgi:hypothetical protein